MSHRQSRRQLAKREKALKVLQSKTEQLHSKYDELFDEYRSEQRRFEMLCTRYIQMQLKKKQQIFNLKNTLGQASECIFHAQVVIDECCHAEKSPISPENLESFRRNLECFMDALRNCCCLRKVHELQQQQRKRRKWKSVRTRIQSMTCSHRRPGNAQVKSRVVTPTFRISPIDILVFDVTGIQLVKSSLLVTT